MNSEIRPIIKDICERLLALDACGGDDVSNVRRIRDACQRLLDKGADAPAAIDQLSVVVRSLSDTDMLLYYDIATLHLRLLLKSPTTMELSLAAVLRLYREMLLRRRFTLAYWDTVVVTRAQFVGLLVDLKGAPTIYCDPVKLLTVRCLRALWAGCDADVRTRLFAEVPALAHQVFALLRVFNASCNLDVSLESLRAISDLLVPVSGDVSAEQGLVVKRADAIACMLAGMVLEPFGRLSKDNVQHHSLVLEYLSIVERATLLTLSDASYSSSTTQETGQSVEDSCSVGTLAELGIVRNEAWFVATGDNLSTVLQQSLTLFLTRQHQSVRVALVDVCRRLLLTCRRALKRAVGAMLDTVLALRNDAHPDVSARAVVCLAELDTVPQLRPKMLSRLEEGVFTLCGRLPLLVRHQSSVSVEAAFQQLLGYVQTLGTKGICALGRSEAHVDCFIDSLYQVIEFEFTKASIVSEDVPASVESISGRIPLCNIASTSHLFEVVEELGRLDVDMVFVNIFLDKFHESSIFEAKSCLLISHYLRGAFDERSASLHIDAHMAGFVAELLTAVFTRLKSVTLDYSPSDSLAGVDNMVYSDDTVLACAILAVTARCATLMKRNFRSKLQFCLYDLLLVLSTNQIVVKDAARDTLEVVATSCEYVDVSALLLDNLDYLVSLLTLRLRHPSLHPRAPRTLMMFLEHCEDKAAYEQVECVVDDLILAIDSHHEERCILYVKTLLAYTKAAERWFCKDNKAADTDLTATPVLESDSPMDHELQDEEAASAPHHVLSTVAVLRRTKHLLSSRHLPLRLAVMDLLMQALSVVAPYDDQLLPMVHQNWAGVLSRFAEIDYKRRLYLKETTTGDGEALVADKAFQVILAMARVSRDFVCRRVLDEFWPLCLAFLQRKAERSRGCGAFYMRTDVFRLQAKLLANLHWLFSQIGVREPTAWASLTSVAALYTNDERQSEDLRTLARRILQPPCPTNSHEQSE